MAKRLSTKKLEQMFRTYQQRQSVQFVAQKCQVSRTTVKKYRISENWEARLKTIRRRARIIADKKSAVDLADNLGIVRNLKGKLLKGLEKRKTVKSQYPINDLNTLVRLELLLMGLPDSRVGKEVDDEFKDMSVDELLALRDKLQAAQGVGHGSSD